MCQMNARKKIPDTGRCVGYWPWRGFVTGERYHLDDEEEVGVRAECVTHDENGDQLVHGEVRDQQGHAADG
jgi:hypothetical protein